VLLAAGTSLSVGTSPASPVEDTPLAVGIGLSLTSPYPRRRGFFLKMRNIRESRSWTSKHNQFCCGRTARARDVLHLRQQRLKLKEFKRNPRVVQTSPIWTLHRSSTFNVQCSLAMIMAIIWAVRPNSNNRFHSSKKK